MTRLLAIVPLLLLTAATPRETTDMPPVWPPPPAEPRVEYLDEFRCDDLTLKTGFLGKLKRIVVGADEDARVALPFDVFVAGRTLYMTCQKLPALVAVDLDDMSYRLYNDDERPLRYPIGVCGGAGAVFVTDSEARTVYRFADGRLEPFITGGLTRPTGIAALPAKNRLFIVDTGDHAVKMFDLEGNFIRSVGVQAGPDEGFNYPTFAAAAGDGDVLINDALNYRIKHIDADGNLLASFGEEGDGPGTFSRPKGIAVDSRDYVYVVDNMFDNVQVFDRTGRVLLVIGAGGNESGQFWSPGGIDIVRDTIYIADTYNNRIQVLRYVGGDE